MFRVFNQLQSYLTCAAENFPDNIALQIGSKSYTYSEIEMFSNVLANAFLRLGAHRGDKVLLCLENSFEVTIAFWASLKASLTVTILNPTTPGKKLFYVAHDLMPKFIFFDSKLTKFGEVKASSIFSKSIFIDIREDNKNEAVNFKLLFAMGDLSKIKSTNLDIDLACIIYTSGSTGTPKGVMLTHRNMLVAADSVQSYLNLNRHDVIISSLPVSFDYGLYQLILATKCGAKVILEKDFIWPISFLKKAETLGATVFPVVSTMLSLIEHNNFNYNFDLKKIRMITNTGVTLLKRHIKLVRKIFPKAKIFSMYGLTECKRCTYLPPEYIDAKPTSVGIAIPNTEVFIVNENGEQVSPTQIGQIVIRGNTVMRGYLNKPDETQAVLKPNLLPNENVLYTGDYGYLDQDGFLYLNGRKDEVIKCLGQKVSLKVIEETISTLSGISEVAAIVLPHKSKDHAVVVFVSVKKYFTLSTDSIISFCKQSLEKTHFPDAVLIIPTLPKNINGKIDKLELKNYFYTVKNENVH